MNSHCLSGPYPEAISKSVNRCPIARWVRSNFNSIRFYLKKTSAKRVDTQRLLRPLRPVVFIDNAVIESFVIHNGKRAGGQ
jgi:hypothetical protein